MAQLEKIENICPVTEMVSGAHDRLTIEKWLKQFMDNVMKNLGDSTLWPPFKNVIIDFSWAFMHGISITWNAMNTILEYLDMCYKVVNSS